MAAPQLRGDSEVDVLKEAFSMYTKDSKSLLRIKDKTIQCYDGVRRQLSTGLQQAVEERGLKLLERKEQREIGRVSQKPNLIFIGQTNSGKSSLINLILGGTFVVARETPCTARLVKLRYGDKPMAYVVSKDDKIIEQREIKRRVPQEFIELKKGRRDPEAIGTYVLAQVKSEFLESGIELVDSPGLQENEELDKMVLGELRKVVPFVVYVLDGKNQLTNQDRDDIRKVQEGHRDIFFVVTKVDKDEDEDDDDDDIPEEEVVREKKTRAYNSLVKEGFLPAGVPMEKCLTFHGISNWRVKQYQKDRSRAYIPFVDDYDHFKNCLCNFVSSSLGAIIVSASTTLVASHTRCLDFFIGRATKSKHTEEESKKKMEMCRQTENKIYSKMVNKIRNRKSGLTRSAAKAITDKKDEILKIASKFKFRDIDVPRDELINNNELAKQCTDQIERLVISLLSTNITETLGSAFKDEDDILSDLVNVAKELENIGHDSRTDSESESDYTISEILKQCTMSSYNVENAITLEKGTWKSSMRKYMKKTLFLVRNPMAAWRGQLSVNEKWKRSVAGDILSRVNAEAIATRVIEQATQHLETCHESFGEAMTDLETVLKYAFKTNDKERSRIRDMAPKIARLELETHSIIDTRKYGIPTLGRKIGQGSQGDVFECGNFVNGEPCVIKVIDMKRKINDPDDLALEVHYTRSFGSYDRILPLYASIEHDGYLFLVTPRMKWDLMKALPHIKYEVTRLQIAIETAKAIRFLHGEGIVHRDIKTENVLLSDDGDVKVADFGLCKAEGLITDSIVGAPIAMPPEVIRGEAHNKSIDVYAFGILLWFILEGSGTCPKNYAQVRRPTDLMFLCMDGHRPEYISKFDKKSWDLMQRCWSGEAHDRPTFDEIVNELIKIKYKTDPNKT
ncbi:dual serine/threonine and tyrosine protein kinase-like [Glandiceps talaboti]